MNETPSLSPTSIPSHSLICYTGSYKHSIMNHAITKLSYSIQDNEHVLIVTPSSVTHWSTLVPKTDTTKLRFFPVNSYMDLLNFPIKLNKLVSPRTKAILFYFPFDLLHDGVIQRVNTTITNSLGSPRIIGLFLSLLHHVQLVHSLNIALTYDTSSRSGRQSPWILKLLDTFHVIISPIPSETDQNYSSTIE